jgi:tRNA/tmRNA/rRNA uracil-C5-methylase (TrmA/RlmC/RlmD family)
VPGLTGVTVAAPGSVDAQLLSGDRYVRDPISTLVDNAETASTDAVLRRRAPAFFQGNRYLLRTLVTQVVSRAGEDAVADLYAGVGLFACALAATGRERIVAVEGDRITGEDLVENAAAFEGAVRVEKRGVESFLATANPGDFGTVIVDPSRTGLSREAIARLTALRAGRLVYVSCDVATLARDTRALSAGGYRLESLEAFDLFPNTAHIETLAAFRLDG